MTGRIYCLLALNLIISMSSSASASEIRFLGRHTFESGANIRDVTCNGSTFYAVDSGNSCLYAMRAQNGSLLIESTFNSFSDPRALTHLPGLGLLVSDKGERCLCLVRGSEFSRVTGYTGSPDRLFSGEGACYALQIIIPSGEETAYSYRVEKLTLSNQDGETLCRSEIIWEDERSMRDIFGFLTSYPRIVVIGSDVGLALLLKPSSTEWGVFSVLESSDRNVYHPGWSLNYHGSWGEMLPRREAELENLRALVAIDPYFTWDPVSLPDDYMYRRIVSESGAYQSKLLALRTSGDYPVIDVIDLAGRNTRYEPNPLEMDDHTKSVFPPQEALEGYWQYRIADRRLMAFNRNTVYVFEIRSL